MLTRTDYCDDQHQMNMEVFGILIKFLMSDCPKF
jgi:hypothetical protein